MHIYILDMNTRTQYIIYTLLACILWLCPQNVVHAVPSRKFTIVIDAGHGGNDSGALGRRSKEKDINLSVALKLGKLIEDKCNDTKVIYTRKRDIFIPLHKRAQIANDAKADLFISIHTNSVASRNSNVYGAETYTLGLHRTKDNLEVAQKENSVILIEEDYKQRYAGFNPKSAESYIIFEFMQDNNMMQSVNFAKNIQRQFKKNNRRDKGVHQAGFLVLRQTSMPSVLVELGYITNPSEESFLNSGRGSTIMAESIYKAFIDYKNSNRTDNSKARTEYKPETKETKASPSKPDSTKKSSSPIFKIQILTSLKLLPTHSREFRGLQGVDHYKERGMIKYTYGSDTDYNKILRLKRNVVDRKFKDAFIIAFKDGEKININAAIKEFKEKR